MWKQKVAGLLILILGMSLCLEAYENFLHDHKENGDLGHPYGLIGWIIATVAIVGFAASLLMKQESEGYFPLRVRTIGIIFFVNASLMLLLLREFGIPESFGPMVLNHSESRWDIAMAMLFYLLNTLSFLFIGFFLWIARWSVADNPEEQWRGWRIVVQICGGILFLGGLYSQAVGPRWFADLLANSEGKGGLTEILIIDILVITLISGYLAGGYGLLKKEKKSAMSPVV